VEEEAISPSIRQSNTRQKNQLKITRSKNGSKMNIQITLRPSTTKTSLGDTTRTAARLTMSPSEVGIIKEEAILPETNTTKKNSTKAEMNIPRMTIMMSRSLFTLSVSRMIEISMIGGHKSQNVRIEVITKITELLCASILRCMVNAIMERSVTFHMKSPEKKRDLTTILLVEVTVETTITRMTEGIITSKIGGTPTKKEVVVAVAEDVVSVVEVVELQEAAEAVAEETGTRTNIPDTNSTMMAMSSANLTTMTIEEI